MKTSPEETTFNRNYQLMIKSEYIGDKNCSDELYESKNIEYPFHIILAICKELIKLDTYQLDYLKPNELVIGLDTGPYNFVMKSGLAYYVDFYPPRHRTTRGGRRLKNSEVLTDYPAPRDKAHGQHLRKYFYTRNGLWVHGLSHLFAALDSNDILAVAWQNTEQAILTKIYELIDSAGLHERVQFLKDNLHSSTSGNNLRERYHNHRSHYYRNKYRGFNLSEYKIINNVIYKSYLANPRTGTPFDQSEGQKMLDSCIHYYQILRDNVGMTVPETEFELIKFC